MREILFRGKRPENGEWVYGYYVHNGPVNYETEYIIPYYASAFYGFQVYPNTVGQYTGLTDKNGNRIFEGDILKWDSMEWGCDHLEIASWDYELFNMRRNDWEEWCEVIGNIHDNPELLEK